MLIFSLIHDEDDDHKGQRERIDLQKLLDSKGVDMMQKSTLEWHAYRAQRAAEEEREALR